MNESKFDPSQRRLCPDGACVGLIGNDGRCRECGLPASASAASASASAFPSPGAPDAPLTDVITDTAGHQSRLAGPGGTGDTRDEGGDQGFRPDRRLCEDGDCIGVLDDSGSCPVCGRRAS
jgi:hypothetical protein